MNINANSNRPPATSPISLSVSNRNMLIISPFEIRMIHLQIQSMSITKIRIKEMRLLGCRQKYVFMLP